MSQRCEAEHKFGQARNESSLSLRRLLKSEALAPLSRRATALQRATDHLRAGLGATLGNHCQVANRRGDTLVLTTDSAAWASRLRFLAPQLLKALSDAEGWSGLHKLKVLVRPADAMPKHPASRRLALSVKSAELLTDVAEATQDRALREVLLRLSRRCEQVAGTT